MTCKGGRGRLARGTVRPGGGLLSKVCRRVGVAFSWRRLTGLVVWTGREKGFGSVYLRMFDLLGMLAKVKGFWRRVGFLIF